MPKSEVIVRTALAELGLTGASTLDSKGKSPDDILKNFNSYLNQAFVKSLVVLERFEGKVYPIVLRELARRRFAILNPIEISGGKEFSAKVGDALDKLYPDLWKVFLS